MNIRFGKSMVNNDTKVPKNGLLIWRAKKNLKIKTSTLAKIDSKLKKKQSSKNLRPIQKGYHNKIKHRIVVVRERLKLNWRSSAKLDQQTFKQHSYGMF